MTDTSWHKIVAEGYDQVADTYAALEDGTEWPRMRWLAQVLDRLPAGSRVLDLGCGNGVPATAAIAEAHHATGVDISPEQIAQAQTNVPGARFTVADLAELDFPSKSFDAVVAFYTIDHLPRDMHAALLVRIHRWLTDGGLLLFSVEPEDNPGVVGDWLGTQMYFSSHPADVTRRLVTDAGFEIVQDRVEQQHEGGNPVDWLWILARKQP